MIKIIVQGALGLGFILLLIYGFIYENKVIEFEQCVAWFWRECKRQGRTKAFFLKGIITCCIQEIKERVGH